MIPSTQFKMFKGARAILLLYHGELYCIEFLYCIKLYRNYWLVNVTLYKINFKLLVIVVQGTCECVNWELYGIYLSVFKSFDIFKEFRKFVCFVVHSFHSQWLFCLYFLRKLYSCSLILLYDQSETRVFTKVWFLS